MRNGYGVGGGATAIETTRRRWLAVLLAFLLGAAMAFVASPAQSGEYGNGAPDVTIIEPGDGDVFGIPDTVNLEATFTDEEWESESETTYTCEIDWDDGTVENSDDDDVTVTSNANPVFDPGTVAGNDIKIDGEGGADELTGEDNLSAGNALELKSIDSI